MSRVAKQCLDYSITLIKINFMFILVLQAMKLLIGMTDVSQQEQHDQQMRPIITNSSYDNLSQYSSFHDYLKYLSRLWTSNSYDINLMEATKTEIVNVYDEPSDSGDANFAADGSTPLVTFKSFVNFTEFIQYNNLKNMIKLAFVLNLNLTTLITNLIVISYLLVNRRAFYFLGIRLGRRFVRANLVLNLTLLVLLLALNTLYLFAFNDYFKKHSSLSTLNKYIHNYISQIFKSENLTSNYGNELPNLADYSVVELKSKLSTAIEYTGGESSSAAALAAASAASAILDPSLVDVDDGFTTESSSIDDDSSCDRFLATLIIKINLALMLFLISLLTFYSYFLNVEGDEDDDEENECGESSMYDKPISKRYESSCYTSSSDESVVSHDEKKKLLKCNSTSSLPCVVVSDVELVESEAVEEESPFVRLKQKKNRHQIEFNLLWIIHSLFVIYVLSIWDVSDVYHYFKVQNWENTNLNLFKQAMEIQPQQDININQSDSTLLKSLIGLNEKNASIASQIDALRNDSSFAGTVSFYNDYVNSYHDNFYHHSFQHSRQNDYSRHHHSHDDEEGSNYSEEFKTTTTIRALFILKIHSKLLSCLLVGFFSALVLYKICRIEQLLEFDFERFKREQYSFKRKFIDI